MVKVIESRDLNRTWDSNAYEDKLEGRNVWCPALFKDPVKSSGCCKFGLLLRIVSVAVTSNVGDGVFTSKTIPEISYPRGAYLGGNSHGMTLRGADGNCRALSYIQEIRQRGVGVHLVGGERHDCEGEGSVGGVVGALDGPAAEGEAIRQHRHAVGVPVAGSHRVAEQDLPRGGPRSGVGGVAGLPPDADGDEGFPRDRHRLAEGQAHRDGVAGGVG